MSALTKDRYAMTLRGVLKKATFPLQVGAKAWKNGVACIDTANPGTVAPAGVSTTIKAIGLFEEARDNSGGSGVIPVPVELARERPLLYLDSVVGAGAITIATLFQLCYWASDHEVTSIATGASPAGIVWAVDAWGWTMGKRSDPGAVAVEIL